MRNTAERFGRVCVCCAVGMWLEAVPCLWFAKLWGQTMLPSSLSPLCSVPTPQCAEPEERINTQTMPLRGNPNPSGLMGSMF